MAFLINHFELIRIQLIINLSYSITNTGCKMVNLKVQLEDIVTDS